MSAAADAPRQLEDEVRQSAEEAVLAEAGATEFVAEPENRSVSWASPDTIRPRHLQNPYSRYEDAVRRYVAAQPCQLALLVGALAMPVPRPGWQCGRRVVKQGARTR